MSRIVMRRRESGGESMGRIRVGVRVGSFADPACELRFDALVDTGAYCLTLPAAWRAQLGSLPVCAPVDVELADGRLVAAEICGPVAIEIEGFRVVSGEVLFVAAVSDEVFEPLLGHVTLEQAGVAVDLVRRRLMRVPHFDLKRGSTQAFA